MAAQNEQSNEQAKPGLTPVFLVIAMVSLAVTELLTVYTNWALAPSLGVAAFLAMALLMTAKFELREWLLFAFAILLAIGLFNVENDFEGILRALSRAAFFAAFIYLVTLLKEAAERSPSVLQLGQYLTQQPRGRRYFTLAGGGHVMGVLLNFGAVSLLTPLIQRGARAGSKNIEKAKAAEQQQISALLRGFSWMIMWSPTALTQAVLFTAFPAINVAFVALLGIGASIVMMVIGRIEDRFRWRNFKFDENSTAPVFPKEAAKRFFAICLLLIISTFLVVIIFAKSGAIALMLTAPIVMFIWMFAQTDDATPSARAKNTIQSISKILVGSSSALGRNSFLLGTAAFIGDVAARLTPVDRVAEFLNIEQMPAWAFLASLPVIITICGQVALSPLLVVVFLGAVINALPVMPADPNLVVFALGAGWAMSMSASPNATATLLIAGIAKIPPTTLTWRWNGIYAILCYLVFVISFYILAEIVIVTP